MDKYKAAIIGCSRMGGFIDHEMESGGHITLPYSHAAGYYACERTSIVACSDVRVDVMKEFGELYDVPKERQYLDYRELIKNELPDIVSVATQPEHRAEIVIYAAEYGVKAIYAEKAMAASLKEADSMVDAVERNGVAFNLGTNRRWEPGYEKMREVINSGTLGMLKSLIIYSTGSLFNTASHHLDLAMRLNNDQPAAWVQSLLPSVATEDFARFEGNRLMEDPIGHGIVQFQNGVTAYALNTGHTGFEAICSQGVLTSYEPEKEWRLREVRGPKDHRGRRHLIHGKFPEFQPASSTLRIIEDLVHCLDTGEAPQGGVRVARANTELIFSFIESQLRGGSKVDLPLKESKLFLRRDHTPRQPILKRPE